MHREALIQIGVIGGQQLDDAAIAAEHAIDEQTQLFLHELTRIEQTARLRELSAVGHDLVELLDVEPLEREVFDERLRALVGQHSFHLCGQNTRVSESRCFGQLEQLLIGQAAPQEERQPRRELEVAQRARCPRLRRTPLDR